MFLSIKGIYYQAEVLGQTITWLVPYQFAHDVSTGETLTKILSSHALNVATDYLCTFVVLTVYVVQCIAIKLQFIILEL